MDKQLSKDEASILLNSNDVAVVTDTLLDVCFNCDDWEWVQNECIKLINNANVDVRGLAITCLGHVARIHSKIDKAKVLPILEKFMKDEKISGRVQDALDDIEMFAKG